MGVYVADFLVRRSIDEFKNNAMNLVKMTNVGLLNSFLEIPELKIDGEIILFHLAFPLKILMQYDLQDDKSEQPMVERHV